MELSNYNLLDKDLKVQEGQSNADWGQIVTDNLGNLLNLGSAAFTYFAAKQNQGNQGGGGNSQTSAPTPAPQIPPSNYYNNQNNGGDKNSKDTKKFLGMPQSVGITFAAVGGILVLLFAYLGIKKINGK